MVLELSTVKRAIFPSGKKQYLIMDSAGNIKVKGVGSKNRLTGYTQEKLD